MSAMRILSKAEFEKKLTECGFKKTAAKTETQTVWLYEASGKSYSIPHYAEEYPDHILDYYLSAVDALYKHDGTGCTEKHYSVSEADTPKVVNMADHKG